MNHNKDVELLTEAYEKVIKEDSNMMIASGSYVREARPQENKPTTDVSVNDAKHYYHPAQNLAQQMFEATSMRPNNENDIEAVNYTLANMKINDLMNESDEIAVVLVKALTNPVVAEHIILSSVKSPQGM